MRIWKRSMFSVVRKPLKTLLLFSVVFVISSLLLAGMAGKNSSIQVQDKAKASAGSSVRLEINLEDYRKRSGEVPGIPLPGNLWMSTAPNNSFSSVLTEDIKALAGIEGISGYNVTTYNTVAVPVDFTRIEYKDVDQSQDFLGVNLYGDLDTSRNPNVLNGNIVLKEGRWVKEDDRDAAVISEELAQLNNLETGDTITLGGYHDKQGENDRKISVVGIFQIKNKISHTMTGDTFTSENTIFTNLRFPEIIQGSEGDPGYQQALFLVEDMDKYEHVKAEMEKAVVTKERYDLIDNQGISSRMADNFHDLSKASDIMLAIVVISSVFLLFLIFLYWIKSRNHEIGIYLAMGDSKKKIWAQFLTEGLVIGIFAFALSIAAAPAIAGTAAEYMAGSQAKEAERKKEADAGMVSGGGGETETFAGVRIDITRDMRALTGISVVILIAGTVSLAGAVMMRKSPVHILSEMS
ncbi:ABC transporter permease [Qiania dongpingensis]|uniref:FtsX-like permease family protein n=1 Tax=Qiania dongpingensis TaxID=2763669 RepID=A0A7G9G1V3_9FIRM|nr:FtsX-like permease family protein [Qiania dongpingensis]QNM04785.1 FtsX-like permease family protein [Qiania dongpingensis]